MGEVIRFVPKAERERARLIRQARAIYDSIFPSDGRIVEQQKAPAGQPSGGANRGDGVLRS
jgi:hypothetical protein